MLLVKLQIKLNQIKPYVPVNLVPLHVSFLTIPRWQGLYAQQIRFIFLFNYSFEFRSFLPCIATTSDSITLSLCGIFLSLSYMNKPY